MLFPPSTNSEHAHSAPDGELRPMARSPQHYGFYDETPIGPLLASGCFSVEADAEAAEHDLSSALRIRAGINKQARAAELRESSGKQSKMKLALGEPRKRAPKTPRIPKVIAPTDYRSILKSRGFATASGVKYHMALLQLQGKGTQVTIPPSTNLPAHALVSTIYACRRGGWKPRVHVSLCPSTYGVTVRWLEDDERMPARPRSVFGLDALTGFGEFADVSVSMFPASMHPNVRQRVLYLDHVLSRRGFRRRVQIEVLTSEVETHHRLTAVLKNRAQDLSRPLPAFGNTPAVAPIIPLASPMYLSDASRESRQQIHRESILTAPLRNTPILITDALQPEALQPVFF